MDITNPILFEVLTARQRRLRGPRFAFFLSRSARGSATPSSRRRSRRAPVASGEVTSGGVTSTGVTSTGIGFLGAPDSGSNRRPFPRAGSFGALRRFLRGQQEAVNRRQAVNAGRPGQAEEAGSEVDPDAAGWREALGLAAAGAAILAALVI